MGVRASAGIPEWWTLFLLGCIYTVGELGHFLLGTVSRPMAQELHFGDKACLKIPNLNVSISSSDLCSRVQEEVLCADTSVTVGGEVILPCEWTYNGLGLEYHILAGPAFIAVFTVSGIAWGHFADKWRRVPCLAVATFFFSLSIMATSLSTSYWHVFISRMALAAWESASTPIAAGLIADLFPKRNRGMAMGLFNMGIYLGFGTSFIVGNHVTAANILNQGWRACYILSGMPGIVIAFVFFLTAKEPERTRDDRLEDGSLETRSSQGETSQTITGLELGLQTLKNPAMIFLVLAACIRHAGGFCWGYNSALYFKTYYPDFDASLWLTGISIGAGVFGVFVGGVLSDKLVGRFGISARALLLCISQLIASPFAFAQLFTGPPLSLYFLFGAYIMAEMWFGVMFAILVELVPPEIRSKAVAVALFCINNVGGNTPVLVDPLSHAFSYRTALSILYPGALLTSSLLFFLCWAILMKQKIALAKNAAASGDKIAKSQSVGKN